MKRAVGRTVSWQAASRQLLGDVPELILGSYGVTGYGMAQGLALQAGLWRQAMADGRLPRHEFRASLIPTAQLTSAMVEALLRSVPIADREAEFALLCDESDRVLTGRPHAVILQSGIE